LAAGFQEGDIKAGLANGGRILNALVVCRTTDDGFEHVPYLRASWCRGFRPLRTWADRGDRTYRDLNRLVSLVREDFGYSGYIILFKAGDAGLARYAAIAPHDRVVEPPDASTD